MYSSQFPVRRVLLIFVLFFWLSGSDRGLLSTCFCEETAPHQGASEAATALTAVSELSDSVTLDACLTSALSRNLTLEQSMVSIQNRLEEIREVRGTAYPQVGLEASYIRLGNLSKIDFGEGIKVSFVPEDNYLAKLMLTQILYSGGQVSAALRLAKAAKEAVEIERDIARDTVTMMTCIYFYNALLTEDLVFVANETIDLVQAHLNNVMVMKEQGLVSEFDLLRAEVELANVKPLQIQAKNNREIAYARLTDLVQWPSAIHVVSGSFDPEIRPVDEAAILREALETRAEIKAIDVAINMAKEAMTISKGDRKPTVVFFANYDWANDEVDLASGDYSWNYGWNLGVQASWKIFTGHATSARIKKSEGNIRLVELEKQKIINSIRLEVREAVDNYHQAVELLQSQEKNVEQARKSLEIAEVRYRQGISTQLEVMDSRTALSRARSNYSISLHSLALSRIAIDKARGILPRYVPQTLISHTSQLVETSLPATEDSTAENPTPNVTDMSTDNLKTSE